MAITSGDRAAAGQGRGRRGRPRAGRRAGRRAGPRAVAGRLGRDRRTCSWARRPGPATGRAGCGRRPPGRSRWCRPPTSRRRCCTCSTSRSPTPWSARRSPTARWPPGRRRPARRERLQKVDDLEQAAQRVQKLVAPFFNGLVIAQLLLYGGAAIVLRHSWAAGSQAPPAADRSSAAPRWSSRACRSRRTWPTPCRGGGHQHALLMVVLVVAGYVTGADPGRPARPVAAPAARPVRRGRRADLGGAGRRHRDRLAAADVEPDGAAAGGGRAVLRLLERGVRAVRAPARCCSPSRSPTTSSQPDAAPGGRAARRGHRRGGHRSGRQPRVGQRLRRPDGAGAGLRGADPAGARGPAVLAQGAADRRRHGAAADRGLGRWTGCGRRTARPTWAGSCRP